MRKNTRPAWLITVPLTVGAVVCTPALALANEVSPEATVAPEAVTDTTQPVTEPIVEPAPEPASAPVEEVAPAPSTEDIPSAPVAPVVDQPVAEPAPESAPQLVALPTPEVAVAPVEEVAPVVAPDTEKPVVSLVDPPTKPINSNNVDLVIQASDNVELDKIVGNIRNAAGTLVKPAQIAVDGATGTLTVDLSGLGNGSYSLRYNALDAAGNLSETKSFDFVVDNTAPTVTIKPESVGKDGIYRSVSFKLYDAGKIDRIELNGVVKDLSDNVYSDLNGVKPGVYGAVQGTNTLKVYDLAGNVTIVVFPLDTAGPTFTVKPEGTLGADGVYQKVSFKLHDPSKVDKVFINGVEKDLSDNVWSDLNGIVPGVFGAKEGVNTLVLVDVLGNQSTYTFILDTTKPVINVPASGGWVSGVHTWTITQDEANPAKAYVEIQQKDANGKWQKLQWFEVKDSNDLTATFDTTKLVSGAETQIKISSTDKAGNHTSKTFSVGIDNVGPTISLKPESIGRDGVFSYASFKLFDGLSGVDKVFVNGVEKDLSNNTWSDLNGLVPGKFGAVEGMNLITLQDVAGNSVTLVVYLDVTAPTVVDVQHEWQADRNREAITVTFSEPVFDLPQGWYGSGTTWTKVFYNTKPHELTFEDQAGNKGSATITPKGAPVVEQPEAPTEPSNPEEPGPLNPEPSNPVLPEPSDNSGEQPTTGTAPEDYSQGDDVTPTGSQPADTTQSTSSATVQVAAQTAESPKPAALADTGVTALLALLASGGSIASGGGLKRFSLKRSR